jgi:serine/threonine protein kinase
MEDVSNKYEFVKHLGTFGFGQIDIWRDKILNTKVVSKALIEPTYENCVRLIEEGKTYMALSQHKHIIDLVAYRFNYTNPCLVLPFYETNLQSWIGGTNWYDALIVLQHGALALQGIRSLGADHRDIKPSNMYVDRDADGKWFVRVGDLGLGRLPRPIINSNLTYNAFGTFGYKAWELYVPNAKFTPECDICSLGITGIELITGSRDRASIEKAWINNDAKNLLLAMTSYVPSERPTPETIISTVNNITQGYNKSVSTVFKWGLGALAIALLFGGGND